MFKKQFFKIISLFVNVVFIHSTVLSSTPAAAQVFLKPTQVLPIQIVPPALPLPLVDLIKPTPSAAAIDYVYDELNRLRQKNFPASAILNAQYEYDLGSRLKDANTPAAQVHYNYDTLNRVNDVTQTINSTPVEFGT